jgi:hypothetical protein
MGTKNLSEQEWVFNYLKKSNKPVPLVLGSRGTWGINGNKAIILVAFSLPDIAVMRDLHNVSKNPIREMKYKDIVYYAVNIVAKKQVEYVIDYWKE